MQTGSSLPAWIWKLVRASVDHSLKLDPPEIPRDMRDAVDPDVPWERREIDMDARLKGCTPRQTHYFLYWAYAMQSIPYDTLTPLFAIVIRRRDCDRTTALNFFAWYWSNYVDGRNAWMGDEQHQLMAYIRERAWAAGFKNGGLDVPEGVVQERDEMRNTLVRPDHPFNMPDSFFALSRKEELYFQIRARLYARSARRLN